MLQVLRWILVDQSNKSIIIDYMSCPKVTFCISLKSQKLITTFKTAWGKPEESEKLRAHNGMSQLQLMNPIFISLTQEKNTKFIETRLPAN